MITETVTTAGDAPAAERSVICAGDYINKLTGEQLEYECRRRLNEGCRDIVVDFSQTELVNSVGVSILLGMIDAATNSGARVTFSDVNEPTAQLFDMLGVTRHVNIV